MRSRRPGRERCYAQARGHGQDYALGALAGDDTLVGEGSMFARSWRTPLALLVLVMLLAFAIPVQARDGGVSRFATLPPGPGHPEGIAADAAGNIYAATFEFPPAPNKIHAFGPNGKLKFSISIDFSPLGMIIGSDGGLWVTDFGNGRAVKFLPPATLATFAESITGADGIAFDRQGRLWACANQADELVALNANGRVVARRGSFRGIDRHGVVRGLLFPASLVLVRDSFIVTNTALALTPAVGDEPEEDVTTFTLSRVELNGGGRDDFDEGEDGDD